MVKHAGFTLIELLVVMAVLATLLVLVAPRYHTSVERSREAVLKENLFQLREAIGKYHADKGHYPETLETLAEERYLRRVPIDPITDSDRTWVVVPPADSLTGIWDVRSGAQGRSSKGTEFAAW